MGGVGAPGLCARVGRKACAQCSVHRVVHAGAKIVHACSIHMGHFAPRVAPKIANRKFPV